MNSWLIFRLLLVAILFALAAIYIDWALVFSNLNVDHLLAIILVQPIQFVIIFMLAARFALLTQGHCRGLGSYYEAYLLSIGLNSFVPGKLSELIKVSYLREKADQTVAIILSAIFLEKITDVFFLSLIALFGVGAIWIEVNTNIVILGMVGSIALLLLLPKIEILLAGLFKKLPGKRYHLVLQNMVSEAVTKLRTRAFIGAIFFSGLVWFTSYLMVFAVLRILHGTEIDATAALLIFVAMALGRAIPGLPAGLGTFEAAVVFAMHQLGYGASQALATALTIHASQLVVVTLVSMLVLGRNGTGVRSMIQRVRELDAHNLQD